MEQPQRRHSQSTAARGEGGRTQAHRPQQRTAAAGRGQQSTANRNRTPAKKKRQKMRLRNKKLKFQLLTIVAVVMAVVLCLIVFFRVNHIRVRNNGKPNITQTEQENADASEKHTYYTAQEIEAASGIEKGDNLLTISKEAVAAKIMAELPYISEVDIQRILPGTVDITVSEFDVAYSVEDTDGGWWLINRDGKVLEQTNAAEANTHLTVKALRIQSPSEAKEIVPEQAEDMTEQSAKKTSLIMLLQLLEQYDYCKQLVSVDLTSSYDIRLWYGTQFEIRIGNTEELSYKLSYLEAVLKELKSFQSGVIDLTFTEDKTARFQPFGE